MLSLGKKESLKDPIILEVDPEMIGDEIDHGRIDLGAETRDPEASPEIIKEKRSSERSDSRGRSRNRSVDFQDSRRRDLTPGETVVMISSDEYDRIFQSDQYCKTNEIGQCMILDTGCPRALMGEKQYEDIKRKFKNAKIRIRKNASFKFGPSKIHISEFKVELTLKLEEYELTAQFFVIKDANIPILLKPLVGKIYMKEKKN